MTPQWWPDGTHITFTRDAKLGPTTRDDRGIVFVSVHGSDMRHVTRGDGRYEFYYSPDISPNGRRMVYSTSRYGTEVEGTRRKERNFEIETSRLDGSAKQSLTTNLYHDIWPAWSPDGSRIAFTRMYRINDVFAGIYTMAENGSDERMIVAPNRIEGYATIEEGDRRPKAGPVWSPDGEMLAYVIDEFHRVEGDDDRKIIRDVLYSVRADGSGLTRLFLTKGTTFGENQILGQPAWSPDGGAIAFLHFEQDKSGPDWGIKSLHTIQPDGSDMRLLTETPPSWVSKDAALSWSPDGSMILFSMREVYPVE